MSKPNVSTCPICTCSREMAFSHEILGKHDVDYFYCKNCGFLQTETPYWLDEAYDRAISDLDTGLVSRNLAISKWLSCVLEIYFPPTGRYVDVGGGYGLLTRMMRDCGFDYFWDDPFCENLFAAGFAGPTAERPVAAISAFEVLEHIHDPLKFITNHFDRYKTRTIVFSTLTFAERPPPTDWWYYAFPTGQHISFYQARTLSHIARELGCHTYSTGNNLHVITDVHMNPTLLGLLAKNYFLQLCYRLLSPKMRRRSKTWQDHVAMAAHPASKGRRPVNRQSS